MAPIPRMDASVSRTNSREKLGYANTGEVTNFCFSSVKAVWQAGVHWKIVSLRVRLCSGLASLANWG